MYNGSVSDMRLCDYSICRDLDGIENLNPSQMSTDKKCMQSMLTRALAVALILSARLTTLFSAITLTESFEVHIFNLFNYFSIIFVSDLL